MRARQYVPVANNACFAGMPHTSATWWAWADNELSWLQTRGRIVGGARYQFTTLAHGAPPREIARFYFDAEPGETHYWVRCLWGLYEHAEGRFSEIQINWRVRTESYVGFHPQVDPQTATQVIWGSDVPLERGAMPQLSWPLPQYQRIAEIPSGWSTHSTNPGLLRQNRVLCIEAYVLPAGPWMPRVYLRGAVAVGWREDVL